MKRNPAGRFIVKRRARRLISRSYSYRAEVLIYSCGMWCVCPNTLWLWVGCFSQVLTGAAEPWYVAEGKHKCVKDVKKRAWMHFLSRVVILICLFLFPLTHKPAVRWNQTPGNTHLSLRCVFERFIRVLLLLHHICSNITKQKNSNNQSSFLHHFLISGLPQNVWKFFHDSYTKEHKEKEKALVQMRLAVKNPWVVKL